MHDSKQKELFVYAVREKMKEFAGKEIFYEMWSTACEREKQAPQRWVRTQVLPKSYKVRKKIWRFLGYELFPDDSVRKVQSPTASDPSPADLAVTVEYLIDQLAALRPEQWDQLKHAARLVDQAQRDTPARAQRPSTLPGKPRP